MPVATFKSIEIASLALIGFRPGRERMGKSFCVLLLSAHRSLTVCGLSKSPNQCSQTVWVVTNSFSVMGLLSMSTQSCCWLLQRPIFSIIFFPSTFSLVFSRRKKLELARVCGLICFSLIDDWALINGSHHHHVPHSHPPDHRQSLRSELWFLRSVTRFVFTTTSSRVEIKR